MSNDEAARYHQGQDEFKPLLQYEKVAAYWAEAERKRAAPWGQAQDVTQTIRQEHAA